jgi:hypothetical protein
MTKPKTAVPAVMAGGLLGCLFFFDMRDERLPGQAKMPVFHCTALDEGERMRRMAPSRRIEVEWRRA